MGSSATSRTTARDTLGILASTADQVPLTSEPTKASGHKDQLPTVSKAGTHREFHLRHHTQPPVRQEPTHIAGLSNLDKAQKLQELNKQFCMLLVTHIKLEKSKKE